jgi:UDP-glucose 4-epimerase
MNILMSGGSGFIGSYFLKRFLNLDISVDIISRKSPTNLKNNKVEIYNFDITKPVAFNLKKKYDVFIHLAAANDIDSKNPYNALLKSTYGTRNCLELCRKNNIKNFIYFSTLQVYGDNFEISEKSIIDCKNDYALTHYAAEQYVRMFNHYGINFIILRPSNVYGKFESKTVNRWSLVPGCFCRDAKINSKIKLLSSGKQKRDFISLEDVFGFTLHIINKYDLLTNEVYNLASGDVHSIIELAELVKKRYELKFNSNCDLIVESTIPEYSNEYNVSTKQVLNTGYNLNHSSIIKLQDTIDNLLRG